MKTIKDLEDLLRYYIENLYAAEKQIAEAMPAVIEKVRHQSLKNALQHHQALSKKHCSRLNKIITILHESDDIATGEKEQTMPLQEAILNKGITGLIADTTALMQQELDKSVTDAAIIGCVQQIEHYEICNYGTALAYATQLNLPKAAALLRETLDEEYDADDLLTALAVAALNKEGIPEGWEEDHNKAATEDEENTGTGDNIHSGATINERSIHWPGGRAGTSHRRYPNGESRGH